jgi:translation initiation factor 2 beta subunit (eIF-2beta)/eIF-5
MGVLVGLFFATLVVVASQKEYELKLKFEKDSKAYYKCSGKNMRKTVGGDEDGQQDSIIEHEVKDVSQDGTATLDMKILKLVFKSSKGEYDSEKGKKTLPKERVEMFDALLEKQLKAKVTPDGEVKETEGEKEIAEAIIKGMGDNQMLKMMPKETVQKMVEDSIKTSFGLLFFAFLPKKKVAIGDTWTFEQKQPMVNLIWEAKLKSVKKSGGKELAAIEFVLKDVVLETTDNNPMVAALEVEKNYKGGGKAEFNITDGKTVSVEMNHQYAIKNKITNGPAMETNDSVKAELLKEPPKIGKQDK